MNFDITDFGAIGDGSTDDTAAIQAAIDAAYNAGGGTIFVPKGAYAVTSLSMTFAGALPITFKGEGKFASTFLKIAGTTTPILTLSAPGIFDIYGGFADIGFLGVARAQLASCSIRWRAFGWTGCYSRTAMSDSMCGPASSFKRVIVRSTGTISA